MEWRGISLRLECKNGKGRRKGKAQLASATIIYAWGLFTPPCRFRVLLITEVHFLSLL
jgi:hypothetical protein